MDARPQRPDYLATDLRILRAAATVLETDPQAGLGVIAQRSGVSRATTYRHFSSVDAVLASLRRHALAAEEDARRELLDAIDDEDVAAEVVVHAFGVYLHRFLLAIDPTLEDGAPGIVTWDPQLRLAFAEGVGPAATRAVRSLQRRGIVTGDYPPEVIVGMLGAVLAEAARQVTAGVLPSGSAAAFAQHTVLLGLRARVRQPVA